ncbi:endo-1,4-beta-xylanase [Halomarina oriensis]|uniref:endo-1,4-beta-xylanase n=1 Tax=Halomarina oriensis TaxID=671145 RepID=A0A6B0GKZ1_9EURY|nr:endo-1,4-beta-xylanase [Halomarina oriensis]MWG33463.1 hypothetical protein [Halomarina oriensis]
MAEHSPHRQHKRRTFLQTLAALGLATTGSAAVGAARSSSSSYYETLRSDLTGRGGNRTLPAGEYRIGESESAVLDAFSVVGHGSGSAVDVDADAVPISTATRVEAGNASKHPDSVAYRAHLEAGSVDAGDVLLGVAYLRSDAEDPQVKAVFRRASAGNGTQRASDNAVQRSAVVEPTGEWLRYFFPIVVGEGREPADATPTFEFWTGYGRQTVDIGGIALLDYSDAESVPSLDTLPPYDYEGRAPDADWRAAAEERIDELRKTDVAVRVVDEDGEKVPNAVVDLGMTEHAFDFGSAVSVEHVTGDDEDDQRYREVFLETFNKAVVENGMKWPAWDGVWDIDTDATMATLEWLNDHGVPTRGHYLLWEEYGTDGGGGMNVSGDLPAEEFEATVGEKITNHAERFEGLVTEWDMHNHPVWQSNFRSDEALGWPAVDRWWTAANDATDAELYTNEMGAIGGVWQQDQYYQYLQRLVEDDYPVDGIGFMGHHQQQWGQILDVEQILAGLDRFAEFDLPLLVTEFDIEVFSRQNAQDVAVQRDYTRDFLTALFSHEAVEGVLSWGFWAEDHWRPTGAYYDADWTLRPNGEQFLDLVFDEWWTEETGRVGGDGTLTTRGFEGDYRVLATDGRRVGHTTVTFDDETTTVEVELRPVSEVAADLDGDGRHEDLDGDGDVDGDDAKLLLKNLRSDDVTDHVEVFDFDGDGEITWDDLAALLEELN